MKRLLVLCLFLGFSAFAQEPQTSSQLVAPGEVVGGAVADGSCEMRLPCPDGQHTAYCRAEGPHTRCHRWGDWGVRCVAWNNSGKSTSASQSCP